MSERIRNFGDVPHIPVELSVEAPGLRPEMRNMSGEVTEPTNLEDTDILERVEANLSGSVWFHSLKDHFLTGERKGVFITALGALTVFVAAAGFEFGIRHGRDIKELYQLIENHRKSKEKSP